MERLTRRDLADVNGKQIVLCDSKEEDCNDSCLYRRCKWNEKALQKLKEYEDAEEQGLLLRLPCKVGETVYCFTPFCEICEETLDNQFACEDCNKGSFVSENKFDYEMIRMFGRSIFLTKEEAEQAIARMEKENE